MVLLKFLLFLIAGYYLFSLLSRWLFPKMVGYAANKVRKRMEDQFQAFQEAVQPEEKTAEGITFTRTKKESKRASKDVGEYIDFEEIP